MDHSYKITSARYRITLLIASFAVSSVSSIGLSASDDSSCDGPDICCEVTATQPLFFLLASQVPREFLAKLLNGSSAFSFNPGAKVYSLASGGTNFNFQLLFARTFDAKQANVTFEIELAPSLRNSNLVGQTSPRVISQCRLSCQTKINRVICDVPSIRSIFPNFSEQDTSRHLLALPYDSQQACGLFYDDIPVSFCYEIKINGDRIIFITTEAQRADLPQLLRGIVAEDVVNKITGSLKPINIDQALIYIPDPVVHNAALLTENLTLIKGLGLKSDEALDARFSVFLSIDGLIGEVNCETLDPSDPDYTAHNNETESNESFIICIFKEKELRSLAERNRHQAINGTLVRITASVSSGFWRGSAHFDYNLPPEIFTDLPIIAIVVPISAFVFIVVLTLFICLCVLAKGTSPQVKESASKLRSRCPVSSICIGFSKFQQMETPLHDVGFSLDIFPPQLAAVIESKRLDSSIVRFHEDIGTGHFGTVKRGTFLLTGNNRQSHEIPVAVKFIQNCTDQKQLNEFFEEAVHMFSFDHANVLGAYGLVYGNGDAPALVLPLMDVGDLRRFVQIGSVRVSDLLIVDFAYQIAEGMTYLANKGLIHRDLAARNCLLNKSRVVKIADFGLSRLATNIDYEYVPTYEIQMLRRPMPIRWMAPECIEHGVFSEKTDIWAYGVVLWELASRGLRPYTDLETPVEVIRHVCVVKQVLPQCVPISGILYALMTTCWNEQPSERPKFAELVKMTKSLLNDPTSKLFTSEDETSQQMGNGTNSAEVEIHKHFCDALNVVALRVAAGSAESRHSMPAHAPIPSRRNSMAYQLD